MMKEMTASASYAMKIQVVAPVVGVSSWRQRFRFAEVLCQPSFQPAVSKYLFPDVDIRVNLHDNIMSSSSTIIHFVFLHDEGTDGVAPSTTTIKKSCSTRANVVVWIGESIMSSLSTSSGFLQFLGFFWRVSGFVAFNPASRHLVIRTSRLTISTCVPKTKSMLEDVQKDNEECDQSSTEQPVVRDSGTLDFRIQGLLHSTVEEAEHVRVRELLTRIESRPHRDELRTDLMKDNVYNPFSENSKKMIHDIGNVVYSELCETDSQVHRY